MGGLPKPPARCEPTRASSRLNHHRLVQELPSRGRAWPILGRFGPQGLQSQSEARVMKGSAIILRPEHRDQLFEAIPFQSTMPARDNLVFSMSFFNGMRVCEIAEMPIDRMLGPRGEIL